MALNCVRITVIKRYLLQIFSDVSEIGQEIPSRSVLHYQTDRVAKRTTAKHTYNVPVVSDPLH